MKLQGSCHCQKIKFSLTSSEPVPYMRCYCSVCRKTAGGGGYAINLGGDFASLNVDGKEHVTVYQAMLADEETGELKQSPVQRSFCKHCGSALWGWDPRWPELVHPQASAIDSPLPEPPENTHIMLASKASWAEVGAKNNDQQFNGYPDESLAAWHIRLWLPKTS